MTNAEKQIRTKLLQFMFDNVGGTELNPIKHVESISYHAIEIEYEDGTKQMASLLVTDSDE